MIIGLGHYSRTGKDVTANLICGFAARNGYASRRMSFADPLKAVCHSIFGRYGLKDRAYYEQHPEARDIPLPMLNNKTPVEIWVEFGTPCVRERFNTNTWRDMLLEEASFVPQFIVPVADLRFPNEAQGIRESGGKLVLVKRAGVEPRDTVADQALLGFTGWDYILENNGTVAELDLEVDKMMKYLLNMKG